jgi:hypothetical protein
MLKTLASGSGAGTKKMSPSTASSASAAHRGHARRFVGSRRRRHDAAVGGDREEVGESAEPDHRCSGNVPVGPDERAGDAIAEEVHDGRDVVRQRAGEDLQHRDLEDERPDEQPDPPEADGAEKAEPPPEEGDGREDGDGGCDEDHRGRSGAGSA